MFGAEHRNEQPKPSSGQPGRPAPRSRTTLDSSAESSARPESLILATRVWMGILGLEILRNILGVVNVIADPERLFSTFSELVSPEQQEQLQSAQDSGLLGAVVVTSALLVLLFALAFLGLIAGMMRSLWVRGRRRLIARRALLFFGIYCAVRGASTFFLGTEVGAANTVYALIDGSLVVFIGVLAGLGSFFYSREDLLAWLADPQTTARQKQLRDRGGK